MTDVSALIEKLEKATEPSRELDAEIHCSAFPEDEVLDDYGTPIVKVGVGVDLGCEKPLPAYTSSIDAALTLVPEGKDYIRMERYSDGWYVAVAESSTKPDLFMGVQKPAAIALCIASLRARQKEG